MPAMPRPSSRSGSSAPLSQPAAGSARFVTFEGPEGSGKTTQVQLLADHLRALGLTVVSVREPGGTLIGEEIRHTLQHSQDNRAMTPEAELLLINASRAQLVREIIRPALDAGHWVLSDRFFDSTTVYQGFGRLLDPAHVQTVIDIAVGSTRPARTFLLMIPPALSRQRLQQRRQIAAPVRDRMEEADAAFFERVERGYRALAACEPGRVRLIDAAADVSLVEAAIWNEVQPLLNR